MHGLILPVVSAAETGQPRGPFKLLASRLIRRHPDVWALTLIVVVALALRLGFFLSAPVFFEGDARGYFVRAMEIYSGEGLNFTLKRTPGYSALIAAVFGFSGPNLEAIVLVQHLLGVGTAVAAYGCARAVAGSAAGLVAGLATAASGSQLIYEQVILTETLFTFLLALALWALAVGLQRRSAACLIGSGIATGLGALVRPVGLALVPVALAVSLLLMRWRRALLASGWYLAAFALVLLPWSLRNALANGEAAPVHPGRFLIERTLKHNPTGVSMYADPDRPGDSRLLRTGRRIIREIEPEDPTSFEVHAALVRRLDVSDAEASQLMWELSVDAIRRHPELYLAGTWSEFSQFVVPQDESVEAHLARPSAWKGSDLDRLIREGSVPASLADASPERLKRRGIAEAIAHVYQPSSWIGLILALNLLAAYWSLGKSSRRIVLLPLGTVLAFAVCTVVINGYLPRYRYPLDPLLHVGAAAGIVWTVRALLERRTPETVGALAGPS